MVCAMGYQLQQLSSNLYFVRWLSLATDQEALDYIRELQQIMDTATNKVYFISDLRRGHIANVTMVQRLSRLTQHPNFGGGASFSVSTGAKVFVGVFARFARRYNRRDDIHNNLEGALKFLEDLQPGITKGIDWKAVVDPAPSTTGV